MQVREEVGKSRNTVFFPMICDSGGSKSRFAKATGAEPPGQMRDEKLHAVVARSTCPSQTCQKLMGSDHFGRRCGAKHMSELEVERAEGCGALLDVQM